MIAPSVNITGDTVVAVALNGQQFSKDFILHVKDEENNYMYYDEPYISNFKPKTGPSIGGTRVKINGFGFTPKRDKNGLKDKKKNKVWVRFVDPDSGEELAKPT